jgi:hypothetical protein
MDECVVLAGAGTRRRGVEWCLKIQADHPRKPEPGMFGRHPIEAGRFFIGMNRLAAAT